jgi:hypothetical protein
VAEDVVLYVAASLVVPKIELSVGLARDILGEEGDAVPGLDA